MMRLVMAGAAAFGLIACAEIEDGPPFSLAPDLFDHRQPGTLGLSYPDGAETVTIFRPGAEDDAYNHGVVMIAFKGALYAQWQSSRRDEDAPDTKVVYAVSEDGKDWSSPLTLAPAQEGAVVTSGGWLTDGETLVAYINVWPDDPDKPRGGYAEYMTSADGVSWSARAPLRGADGAPVNGVFEQDPRPLPDGRIISAFHMQPGLIVSPYYTDDPLGVSGWIKGEMENLPREGDVSREIEPSWFYQADGDVVMVFRDQASSFQTLASVSKDRGESWTTPALVAFPDSRSKQSAGNFPGGAAYRVNNPVPSRERYPLVLTLSDDGERFDRAYLLRGKDTMQPMRFEGKYKRESFSYPKSFVTADYLYAAYATNKEDVEFTRVPLASLK